MDYKPHELANFYPMQDAARFAELVEGMKKSGYRDEFPIVIYEGKILDGRNRYTAAIEAGVEPYVVQFSGDDPVDFVIQANSNRRDLEAGQRVAIYKNIVKSKWAEIGQEARKRKAQDFVLSNLTKQKETVNTRKEVAKAARVSEGTVAMVEIVERDAPDLFEKVASGEMKTSRAYTETKKRKVKAELESIEAQEVKASQGVYDVIVIDPPWDMQKIEREVAPNQVAFEYPTMTLDEIAKVEIPTAENCHVFLWTTQKYLPAAFGILAAWNLKYVCTFNWHKAGGFQVVGLPQYNNEFVLYARRGVPQFVDTKNFKTSFEGKRGAHSEKPEEFYETLRRVTAGRRLDMFNRRKIEGFDGWGNEAK